MYRYIKLNALNVYSSAVYIYFSYHIANVRLCGVESNDQITSYKIFRKPPSTIFDRHSDKYKYFGNLASIRNITMSTRIINTIYPSVSCNLHAVVGCRGVECHSLGLLGLRMRYYNGARGAPECSRGTILLHISNW